MTDIPTEKTCTKCGETKPLEDYHRRPERRDGRMSQCKACRNARSRAWRKKNPGYGRAWRDKNPDYHRARAEGDADFFAAWDAAHPERNWRWEGDYRRRAEDYGFEPITEPFTRADVVKLYGDQCWHCKGGAFEHLDHHPIPVAAEGPHTLENVKPSCSHCNGAGSWPARSAREALLAAA